MVIYVELVFLENFAVDCFLLLISGKITNQKCKHVFLASVFGAIYACLLPLWNGFNSPLTKFACLASMLFICFGKKKITAYLHLFASMLILAGALFGVINLLFASFLENGIFYSDGLLFVISLCSVLFAVIFYKLLVPLMQRTRAREHTGMLFVLGKEIPCLIDTGNSLYYGSTPVVLIEKSALQGAEEEKIKPLIIPYSCVGDSGALMGFRPTDALFTFNGETFEIDCVVALSENGFCKNFSGLAHPDLIKEKIC